MTLTSRWRVGKISEGTFYLFETLTAIEFDVGVEGQLTYV